MSLSTFKKTIFVHKDKDGDETYLLAHESVDDAVQEEGLTYVGVYKLERVSRYRRVTELVKEG